MSSPASIILDISHTYSPGERYQQFIGWDPNVNEDQGWLTIKKDVLGPGGWDGSRFELRDYKLADAEVVSEVTEVETAGTTNDPIHLEVKPCVSKMNIPGYSKTVISSKEMGNCPLCSRHMKNIMQHLKMFHKMENPTSLKLFCQKCFRWFYNLPGHQVNCEGEQTNNSLGLSKNWSQIVGSEENRTESKPFSLVPIQDIRNVNFVSKDDLSRKSQQSREKLKKSLNNNTTGGKEENPKIKQQACLEQEVAHNQSHPNLTDSSNDCDYTSNNNDRKSAYEMLREQRIAERIELFNRLGLADDVKGLKYAKQVKKPYTKRKCSTHESRRRSSRIKLKDGATET